MTQSRLRQRVAEIGVRRAFGSTRIEMVGQIVMENLVITLLADRKSTRLNSSHIEESRMPSSA